jgi:general secretion pathway protein G
VRPSLSFWLGIAILGIVLYALVTPRIYSVGKRSPIAAANVDIKGGFKAALDAYKVDNGDYPKGSNGLVELVQQPSGATNWHGPYLDRIPIDPFGKPYIYECPGRHNTNSYDLFSAGPDGRIGTEDDIGNWQK